MRRWRPVAARRIFTPLDLLLRRRSEPPFQRRVAAHVEQGDVFADDLPAEHLEAPAERTADAGRRAPGECASPSEISSPLDVASATPFVIGFTRIDCVARVWLALTEPFVIASESDASSVVMAM